MFWGIEFAAEKLIFCLFGQEKMNESQGKVTELYLVNWLATLIESDTGAF